MKKVFILCFFLIPFLCAGSSKCADIFREINENESHQNSETRYSVRKDGEYWLDSYIIGGALSFGVKIYKNQGDSSNSHSVRGANLFDSMMDHYGNSVKYIIGTWETNTGLEDNLETFNRLISPPSNLSLEEAAFETWTGKMAHSRGFSEVTINETDSIREESGKYSKVKLLFQKPVRD